MKTIVCTGDSHTARQGAAGWDSIMASNDYNPFGTGITSEIDFHGNDYVKRIIKALPDHNIILTADHGGHDLTHGTDLPEDMTIPLIIKKRVPEKREMKGATVLDIAPTVCKILGVDDVPEEWEGKSLI